MFNLEAGMMKAVIIVSLIGFSFFVPCSGQTIIVDPNGFADFTNIQEAIDYSWDGDTVLVRPGIYNMYIMFNGRRITLTSLNPDDSNIVASTIIKNSIFLNFKEGPESVITGFTIIGGTQSAITSLYQYPATPTITKNVIKESTYGIIDCGGIITNNIISDCKTGIRCISDTLICNNTIVNNADNGIHLTSVIIPEVLPVINIKNNIIAYNGRGLFCLGNYARVINSYNCFWNNSTNFDGIATPGKGDFLRDPLFTSSNDYHLKSTAGRWTGTTWAFDDVNSPCIDKGDPDDLTGVELNPNGGRINIGAYGGTSQASKSPSGIIHSVCIAPPSMDTNNDCKIDLIDFAEFASQWLMCGLDPESACLE